MKGLIIRKPWIELILNGEKKWEIRKKRTNIRGFIGLVFRGKLWGFVEITDCKEFSVEELKNYYEYHRVPEEEIIKYAGNRKKLYAWILENPVKLEKPIRIPLKKGIQVWLNIDVKSIEKTMNLEEKMKKIQKN